MARSRNIKPALFKNEVLGDADPLLTILFIGLWTLADREGRLEDRPRRIKAEIFPYRECPDFNGYLTVLEQLGFIHRYSVSEVAIIQILNFSKHQSPHKTEKGSELPEAPATTEFQESTVKAPLNNGSVTDVAALIPDSLNTDSLCIPVGEAAPPEMNIWSLWTGMVGDTQGNRSFLGKQIKAYGDEPVAQALASLSTKNPRPAEPKEFLVGILKGNDHGAGEVLF